ncbi:MAG: cytochrome c peroxidase [Chitinophagaceae bacterium]
MHRKHWIVVFLLVTGMYACNKEVADYFTGFQRPANFPEPGYHFSTNTVTKDGFDLGRKLFYETMLSADNSTSCGSCHIQTSAFTHHGHIVSHGIAGRMGTRNSPPIMNLAWYTSFMWDGGVVDLDLQPIIPITNHVEMDATMADVLNKLRASAVYPALFKKAYGTEEITTSNFLKALSQFMVMCISSHSKYDSVKQHLGSVVFTEAEQKGYALFQLKCSSCHAEPLFTDYSFRNNGLVPSSIDDQGRYLITQNDADKYKFKVPALRNLEYTAPYMHDGRFLTLDAVFDHYTTQVQDMPTLDPLFMQNGFKGISISAAERTAITAFLNTLNDKSFLLDKRFSEQ